MIFSGNLPAAAFGWPVWGGTPLFRVEPAKEGITLFLEIIKRSQL
jgi:hypothetical protein